jgi:anti-sigma factor RsiW
MSSYDCKQIFEMLSQYLDKELPPATCEELERHIADCGPCVEFVESLRKSVQLCSECPPPEPPPSLSPEAKAALASAFRKM